MQDPDWEADLARYPERPWLREQSIWALAVYRFGRRNDRRRGGLVHRLCDRFYWLAFRITETLTGISIPKSAQVGPGLRIYHFGTIIVHANAQIGANCTLRHGVTIGSRVDDGPVPVIDDDVELGPTRRSSAACGSARGRRSAALSWCSATFLLARSP